MSRNRKTHPKKANRGESDTVSTTTESEKLVTTGGFRIFLFLVPIITLVVLGIIALNQQSKPLGDAQVQTATADPDIPGDVTSGTATKITYAFSTNNFVHSPEEEEISEPEIAVGLLTEGNVLLGQGKIEAALEFYFHSLHHDPGSEDAHYNVAIALARLGLQDEAIGHYEEALRIFPDHAEAHINLGNILVERGDIPKAIEHFEESLDIFPDSASAHNNLGRALARQTKIYEATAQFAIAVRMEPGYVEAHFNLGNAYLALDRTDEAISEFAIVLNLRPGFEPAVRAMSRAQRKKALQSAR